MKKQTIKRSVIFSLLVIFLFAVFAQDPLSQSKKSFLWKVQSKTNTVYVLGSIHYLKQEMYSLDEKIEKAFDQSNILGVEANVGDVSKMDVQKLVESAFYSGDETLEKHLSPEAYELVKKHLSELGASLEVANKYRPWFLALTLASIEIVKLGFDPDHGIDRYFLSKAAEKKKIVELESLDYQINLFSNLSEKNQELFLLYTLKDIRVLEQELDRLITAWSSGDEKTVESIITKSVKEDKRLIPVYEKLIIERNKKMASKMEEYLKEKETFFVVVGAGHLVGKQGIIELLKGKGFLVEQL
ncbi:MAG: TraB/GumN family protein [Thermodesulfobacteriota bacterium]